MGLDAQYRDLVDGFAGIAGPHRRPRPAVRRVPAAWLLALALLLAPSSGRAEDPACSVAGMAIDAAYCAGQPTSLLDRRIVFLREIARRIMDIAAFDRMLADDKGAIEIIREQCALEPGEDARRLCHATVLIDRLYALEAAILETLDARLADPDAGDDAVTVPDGRALTVFVAAMTAVRDAPVFFDPVAGDAAGTAAAGTDAVATGLLLRQPPAPSLFRILWQHGTVAWTPVDAWQFDPDQLLPGGRNLSPPFEAAQDAQRARLACIEAALAALKPAGSGRFFGPWRAAGGGFYARLDFPEAATVECLAPADPAMAVVIANHPR